MCDVAGIRPTSVRTYRRLFLTRVLKYFRCRRRVCAVVSIYDTGLCVTDGQKFATKVTTQQIVTNLLSCVSEAHLLI